MLLGFIDQGLLRDAFIFFFGVAGVYLILLCVELIKELLTDW